MVQGTFIAIGILWGFLRGIDEGITMYQPGPRSHPWFERWYHLVGLAEIGALVGAVILAEHTVVSAGALVMITGVLFLSWEAFEAAYLWTRRGQAENHENVWGLYSVDGKKPVIVIHTARLLIGIALILKGVIK